jgi:hypothetical protein
MHNNQNICIYGSAAQVLSLGVATGDNPVRVIDGTMTNGSVVQILCSVSGSYDVSLAAYLGGNRGGTISMVGHVDATTGGQNITAEIDTSGSQFKESDCTIGFTYMSGSVPQTPAVARGRIWAHLSCAKMVDASGTYRMLMDGSLVPTTCRSEVDFVFENCQ